MVYEVFLRSIKMSAHSLHSFSVCNRGPLTHYRWTPIKAAFVLSKRRSSIGRTWYFSASFINKSCRLSAYPDFEARSLARLKSSLVLYNSHYLPEVYSRVSVTRPACVSYGQTTRPDKWPGYQTFQSIVRYAFCCGCFIKSIGKTGAFDRILRNAIHYFG